MAEFLRIPLIPQRNSKEDKGKQRAQLPTDHPAPLILAAPPTTPNDADTAVKKRGRGRPRVHKRDENGKPIIEIGADGERKVPTQKYIKRVRAGGSQSTKPAPSPKPAKRRAESHGGGGQEHAEKRRKTEPWEMEDSAERSAAGVFMGDIAARGVPVEERWEDDDVDAEGEMDDEYFASIQHHDSDGEGAAQGSLDTTTAADKGDCFPFFDDLDIAPLDFSFLSSPEPLAEPVAGPGLFQSKHMHGINEWIETRNLTGDDIARSEGDEIVQRHTNFQFQDDGRESESEAVESPRKDSVSRQFGKRVDGFLLSLYDGFLDENMGAVNNQ